MCRANRPEIVETAEKIMELARSGEIIGIQAVVLHCDATGVNSFRRGGVNYAVVGMLTAAARSSIDDLERSEE